MVEYIPEIRFNGFFMYFFLWNRSAFRIIFEKVTAFRIQREVSCESCMIRNKYSNLR